MTDNSKPNSPIYDKTMKAMGDKFKGLKFGGNYTVTVEETEGKKRKETVSFLACECMARVKLVSVWEG